MRLSNESTRHGMCILCVRDSLSLKAGYIGEYSGEHHRGY